MICVKYKYSEQKRGPSSTNGSYKYIIDNIKMKVLEALSPIGLQKELDELPICYETKQTAEIINIWRI